MAILCIAAWVALALTLVERQVLAQNCPGLWLDNASCTPLANCTGLVCMNSTLSVDKCTDPLKISISVTNAMETSYYTFTSSGNQTNSVNTVSLTTMRNDSYATVQVSQNDDVIIPYAEIPLDQYMCMCASLDSVIDKLATESSPIETACMRNTACTGLECRVTIPLLGDYSVETDTVACQNPPAVFIVMVDPDNKVVFAEYFSYSRTTTITITSTFSVPLSVIITHQDYSMIVQVTATVSGTPYNFLPEQQIILDKSGCGTITPIAPPTRPTGQAITMETCDALNDITLNPILANMGASCLATPSCDVLLCDAAGYEFYTQLLPCDQPPTVFIQVRDTNGAIIFQGVLNDSFTFFSLENVGTVEFIITQTANGISIQIMLYPAVGSISIDLFEEHEIPFDACLCPGVTCPATSPTLESSGSSGLSVDSIIAITVPIVAVLIIVFLACMVVTMVIYVVRKRRKHADRYAFRPMTFVGTLDIDDEEDDEEDDEDDAGRVIYRERDKKITQEDD